MKSRQQQSLQNETRPPMVAALVETSLAPGRDILKGISDYASQHGPWKLYLTPQHINTPPPDWFSAWQGDGIIVRLHDSQSAKAVADKNVPVVDVLGISTRHKYPIVHTDNNAIGRMAAEHFRERGFVNFAYVGLSDENWSSERQVAFRDRLLEEGFDSFAMLWQERSERQISFMNRVQQLATWLETLPLPLAVFVCDDLRTLVVRDAVQQIGLTVGGDVALLGVGNDSLICNLFAPALSSIDAGHYRVGYEAAALLNHLMKGGNSEPRRIMLPPRGVVTRESTDFVAISDEALRRALTFIRDNATRKIGLKDVVEVAQVSRSVIQRRFRKHLNRSIHQCIAEERARRAILMIRETGDSIENIALAVGFQYAQSLNKTLRTLYGRCASDYRSRSTVSL